MMELTERQRQVLEMVKGGVKQIEAAKLLGVSRQYICNVVHLWEREKSEGQERALGLGLEAWEIEDTGCPDGRWGSCRGCPLPWCRYESEPDEL